MYKIKRVYICDICQKVGLPVTYYEPYGDCWKAPPEGWHTVGKYHYCKECYEAVVKIRMKCEKGEKQ